MKTWYLQTFIYIRRLGAGVWVLLLVWLSALGLLFNVLQLRDAAEGYAEEISSLKRDYQDSIATRQLAIDSTEAGPINASQFQKILGESVQLQDYLKTIFQIAEKKGLSLPVGSYKTSHNSVAGYESQILEFPVTGTYQNIREFSEDVLLALPFGALEEMNFKRDSSSSAVLEVRLRFVLFLQPGVSSAGIPQLGRVGLQ